MRANPRLRGMADEEVTEEFVRDFLFKDMEELAYSEDGSMELQLALMLHYGHVPNARKLPYLAVHMFEVSHSKGNLAAGAYLAKLSLLGAEVDLHGADENDLLRAAADAEEPLAFRVLGELYSSATGSEHSMQLAYGSYLRGAELGDPGSMTAVGEMLCYGNGVPADPGRGLQWLERAAERDDPMAMKVLMDIYDAGQLVPRSEEASIEWCLRGAEAGNMECQFVRAMRMLSGDGVEKDEDRAARDIIDIAELGYPYAEFAASMLYENGLGVKASRMKADMYRRRAAAHGIPDEGERGPGS